MTAGVEVITERLFDLILISLPIDILLNKLITSEVLYKIRKIFVAQI